MKIGILVYIQITLYEVHITIDTHLERLPIDTL